MRQKYIIGSVIPFSLGSMIINGLIVYFIMYSRNQTEFSLESISLQNNSLLGISLYIALILTILFASISFSLLKNAVMKADNFQSAPLLFKSFWPDVFVIVLRNAIFSFGLLVLVIELIQTQIHFGIVGLVSASVISGFLSFIITGITLNTTFDSILSKNL
jgi:hypothetical protein